MAEVSIQLFGGEQDGYRVSLELRGVIPEFFYVWPVACNEKIAMATGKARTMLADKMAVLAYRLDDDIDPDDVPSELRYHRHAESDKKLNDPAL